MESRKKRDRKTLFVFVVLLDEEGLFENIAFFLLMFRDIVAKTTLFFSLSFWSTELTCVLGVCHAPLASFVPVHAHWGVFANVLVL